MHIHHRSRGASQSVREKSPEPKRRRTDHRQASSGSRYTDPSNRRLFQVKPSDSSQHPSRGATYSDQRRAYSNQRNLIAQRPAIDPAAQRFFKNLQSDSQNNKMIDRMTTHTKHLIAGDFKSFLENQTFDAVQLSCCLVYLKKIDKKFFKENLRGCQGKLGSEIQRLLGWAGSQHFANMLNGAAQLGFSRSELTINVELLSARMNATLSDASPQHLANMLNGAAQLGFSRSELTINVELLSARINATLRVANSLDLANMLNGALKVVRMNDEAKRSLVSGVLDRFKCILNSQDTFEILDRHLSLSLHCAKEVEHDALNKRMVGCIKLFLRKKNQDRTTDVASLSQAYIGLKNKLDDEDLYGVLKKWFDHAKALSASDKKLLVQKMIRATLLTKRQANFPRQLERLCELIHLYEPNGIQIIGQAMPPSRFSELDRCKPQLGNFGIQILNTLDRTRVQAHLNPESVIEQTQSTPSVQASTLLAVERLEAQAQEAGAQLETRDVRISTVKATAIPANVARARYY